MLNIIDNVKLEKAIQLACHWLADIAQITQDNLPGDTGNSHGYPYRSWKGCVRNHYSAADMRWDLMGPVWHTGQAVKALVRGYCFWGNESYLRAAQAGGSFILDKQVWDETHADHGLILAFEDIGDKVNTSAVLECMDGLILLAEHQANLWSHVIAAGEFLIRQLYLSDRGVFRDVYNPAVHAVFDASPFRTKNNIGGRPLLDDGVLLRLYEKTSNPRFLEAHIRISETLVADQNPPGNWIDYSPCDSCAGSFHPRHTYWWGLPLLETYRITGRKEFLDTAIASGEFCRKAMRSDGGWIRGLYLDNKTDCFGHATSGSACAAILGLELYQETHDPRWLEMAVKALEYCMKVQFINPGDPNLHGAVLEKVLPPDGTDRSPYYIRDLGTIFFVLAGIRFLEICD